MGPLEMGKLKMSQKDITKTIGQILLVRSNINLQYGLLDTPEFHWELTSAQDSYVTVARHMQVQRRTRVLNERLDVLDDLFALLRETKDQGYSHRLEWLIIALIAIEVALDLRHW